MHIITLYNNVRALVDGLARIGNVLTMIRETLGLANKAVT